MATIPLALYLWRRIREVGVESVMGVPGDFNLQFLDFIYKVPGMNFIGNSNELNAAYAADGYDRVKQAPGCLVTTHGVGELSALNGIACAASEHSPVIHVVGQTSRALQNANLMVHHSIGTKPDHQQFNKVSETLRCAAAELHKGLEQAPGAIDRAIRECIIQKQPVYIFFPIDMTTEQVSESLLDTPIDLALPTNKANEDAAVDAILTALRDASNPTILVDFLSWSYGRTEASELVTRANIPFYASHGAKGVVDETSPQYVGLYNAWASEPGIAAAVGACDFVLSLGWFDTDLNSAFFSRKIPAERRIDVLRDHVFVRGKRVDDVYFAPLLRRVTAALDPSMLPHPSKPSLPPMPEAPDQHASQIKHSQFWRALAPILRPGDVLHADTGTAVYGCLEMPLREKSQFVYSAYYGAIGFSTPCALGTDAALRDLARSGGALRGRTILVTGDGSLMLTMQEVATMVQQRLPVLIVIVNNAGYTIERAIHGARQAYNDIPGFRFEAMLALFGAEKPEARFRRVETMAQVDALVQGEPGFFEPEGAPHVLEVIMDKMDLPWRLAAVLNARRPGYLQEEGFPAAEHGLVAPGKPAE